MSPKLQRPSRAGFTILEIIVAVIIISLLVGVLAFRSGSVVDRGKASKIIQTIDAVKKACTMHFVDTGSYAYEYSGYPATYRRLSGTQTYTGWKGPYLEQPLTTTANPFGGGVHVYNVVTSNGWITGFDVDGDGIEEVTGAANMLYYSAIPQDIAKTVDDALDGGLAGDWATVGRVRFLSASQILLVMVHKN